jgi:peptidyl-prolyl cis-trans isomerase SurA
MKRSLFAFALSLSALGAAQASDPVLMKINNKDVKKSEFEYIYNKNNSSSSIDKKTLAEYLVLFTNFKLKVIEAESMGIDTTKAFINELDGYRKQLTQPYLTDKTVEEKLAVEAYDRMKENVEVSHILLLLKEDATPADTLAAFKKISEIRTRLLTQASTKKGAATKLLKTCSKEAFSKIAEEVSEDPSKTENKGYLGFVTSGMTVYPFEIAAYTTPIGELTMPIRTNYGYHLLLIHSRRPDVGQVLVAHIMKITKPKSDSIPADIAEADAKKEIDALYNQIKGGADFGKVAAASSDDKGSAPKNGELPWFGPNRMIKDFETVAFSLKEKGDISAPFKTRFGWHIAKLIDKKGIEPFEAKKEEIIKSFARDFRAQAGQLATIEQIKKENKFTENKTALNEIAQMGQTIKSDSVFQVMAGTMTAQLFSIGGENYTQQNYAAYIKTQPADAKKAGADYVRNLYTAYVNQSVLKFEDSRLEAKYPEFRNLMQEYHDGMLLFEISNNEVWEKASKDNDGLKKYFEQHRKSYDWTIPKYKGLVVSCLNKKIEQKARAIIKKTSADSVVYVLQKSLNDSVVRIKVEKGLYAKGENKVVDAKIFKGAEFVPTSQMPIVFVTGKLLEKAPEDYTDVRGLVTSDYQNFLEEVWLKKLNDKYKVTVFEDVLKTVKQ